MSDSEDAIICELKEKVAALVRDPSDLVFDACLAEIDMLVYELRKCCFRRREVKYDKWLEELEEEIRHDLEKHEIT